MSSQDIEAGASWVQEILSQLEQCDIGIICLTKANLDKPWLYFEAGALAKKMNQARVCPLLIDLDSTDIEYPLAAFQVKTFSKEGLWDILEMINNASTDRLAKEDLREAFEVRWSDFSKELDAILKQPDTRKGRGEKRGQHEILAEILTHVRSTASVLASSKILRKSVSPDLDEASIIRDHLIESAKTKRPLILTWIEASHECRIRDGYFEMDFSVKERMAGESLQRPNNHKWLQDCLSEICNLQLTIYIMRE
jgi:hypothetical protein